MKENTNFLLGKHATIQETIENSPIEKRTIIFRYPAPTQEVVNINNINSFKFYVVLQCSISFTIIKSNTETFAEKFILSFMGPNSSEIRFCGYIQDSETYKFAVATKNNDTSDFVNCLNIDITQDNYEKIKEFSETSVKNTNKQFSIQLYIELLSSLKNSHLGKIENLIENNVALKSK